MIGCPQTEHRTPSILWICSRQVSQTGKREALTRGVRQKRQSAGNRVVKRLAAAVCRIEAIGLRLRVSSTLSARVRSPLLLKTTLLQPAMAVKLGWVNEFSIAPLRARFNDPGHESSMKPARDQIDGGQEL